MLIIDVDIIRPAADSERLLLEVRSVLGVELGEQFGVFGQPPGSHIAHLAQFDDISLLDSPHLDTLLTVFNSPFPRFSSRWKIRTRPLWTGPSIRSRWALQSTYPPRILWVGAPGLLCASRTRIFSSLLTDKTLQLMQIHGDFNEKQKRKAANTKNSSWCMGHVYFVWRLRQMLRQTSINQSGKFEFDS